MNLLKKYRLLMIFIVIMLLFMGSIMAYEYKQSLPEKTSGKILVSRWCKI